MSKDRDSMVIYRSFHEAIKDLPFEAQGEIWNAIFEYGFEALERDLKGISKAVFTLVKPQIDANFKRYETSVENGKKGAIHGKKGGRPPKEKTPKKPLKNPQITPKKPLSKPLYDNVSVNDNESDNVNDLEKEKKIKKEKGFEGFDNEGEKPMKISHQMQDFNSHEATREFIDIYGASNPIKVERALSATINLLCNQGWAVKEAFEMLKQKAASYRAFRQINPKHSFNAENWLEKHEYLTDYHEKLKEIQQQKNYQNNGKHGKSHTLDRYAELGKELGSEFA